MQPKPSFFRIEGDPHARTHTLDHFFCYFYLFFIFKMNSYLHKYFQDFHQRNANAQAENVRKILRFFMKNRTVSRGFLNSA